MDLRPDDRLIRFAREHHGLYRYDDGIRFGLSRQQIARRVRQGRAIRLGTGVYRVTGAPVTARQSLLAATWRTGGVGSHRSAGEVHGVLERRPPKPEVTVHSWCAHEFDGVVVHRSRDLPLARTVTVDGIRVTDPTRTLVDLGQVIGVEELRHAVHVALHRRLTHLDRLAVEYRLVSRQGRRGAGPIGELLRELLPGSAPAESRLELELLDLIREFDLPEPVRQHRVSADGEDFRLDLAYPDVHLFLEGDGFGVHGTEHAFHRDRWRDNLITLQGWTGLHFTWRHLRDRGAVADQIRRALEICGGQSS